MWHGAVKIGVNELDLDHANIDYIIRSILERCGSDLVIQLVPAFLAHIEHEEKIIAAMDRKFPAEHKKEHRHIAVVLHLLEAERNKNMIDDYKFAQEVKTLLTLHVLDFDTKLLQTTEGSC